MHSAGAAHRLLCPPHAGLGGSLGNSLWLQLSLLSGGSWVPGHLWESVGLSPVHVSPVDAAGNPKPQGCHRQHHCPRLWVRSVAAAQPVAPAQVF